MTEIEENKDSNNSITDIDLTLLEKLEALSTKPGVYQFKDEEGKVIYVGKAQNLRNRVRQYFHKSRPDELRINTMVSKISDFEITITDSELEALILEASLIKKIKPRYNVLLRDDKSYPYIAITKEQFPRVFVTRRKTSNAHYYGPYTDIKAMRSALKTVRDIFQIRSCDYDLTENTIAQKKYRICLDYHIKKCEGPCEGLVGRDHYNSKIEQATKILRGKIKSVEDILKEEMNSLSVEMRYEEAALVKERMNALRVYSEKQKVVDLTEPDCDLISIAAKDDNACAVIFKVRDNKIIGSQHFYLYHVNGNSIGNLFETTIEHYYLDQDYIPPCLILSDEPDNKPTLAAWLFSIYGNETIIEIPKGGLKSKLIALVHANAQYWLDELELAKLKRGETVPHVLKSLQRDLQLPSLPRRIECFDISNIQGTDTVASLVVFVNAKPKKSEYRKYIIRTVDGADDFASMQEVIERRYKRLLDEKKVLPNLIVVDGGKGQLSSAGAILEKLNLNKIPTYGLAKRLEELFLPDRQEPIILPRTSSSLRLLQQIRDEAHRFAITFHRSLRSKRTINTELHQIKGIGKKRAVLLLQTFGSIESLRSAREENISTVVGIKYARLIKEYFDKQQNNNSMH